MRALVLVLGVTLCACRPNTWAATAVDPASATSVRTAVPVPVLVTRNAVAEPAAAPRSTLASTCFWEPVTYHKRVAQSPMPADADARLGRCGALAEEERARCRFALARDYFKGNRFERASPLLFAIARDRAAVDAGAAAQLWLESMRMLVDFTEPPRTACSELMVDEMLQLLANLCAPRPAPGAEMACAAMHIMDVDATRCSECVTATVSGRSPDTAYRAAAEIYLELGGAQCVRDNVTLAKTDSLGCAELLYDAYRWFSNGHDPSRAAQAKALLLNPKNGLTHTDLAKRLRHEP
jgi:hypothetical protein